MKGFVYILLSLKDYRQYIGSTTNLKKRLGEHKNGYVASTKNRRPLQLKYFLEYENIETAAKMEKKFKKSHGTLEREIKKRGIAQG